MRYVIPTPDQLADEVIRQPLALLAPHRAIEALVSQIQMELQGDDSLTTEEYYELEAQLDKVAGHRVRSLPQEEETAAE
jgi:hypothetical protein